MYDSSPAARHYPVTPDDDAQLPAACKALFVGGAGTVVVVDSSGVEVPYTVDTVPFVISVCATKVMEEGTSASNIVAWLE